MRYCYCRHSEELHQSSDGRCLECWRLQGLDHPRSAAVTHLHGGPHACEHFEPIPDGFTLLDPKAEPPHGWLYVITPQGEKLIAHFAQDLSGEEQPPFKGWFKGQAGKGPFTQISDPVAWRTLDDFECPECRGTGETCHSSTSYGPCWSCRTRREYREVNQALAANA